MQAAFKTKLKVNNRQANYFTKACGVSRFTWNWGLAEWRKQHEEYKAEKREKAPDWMALKKQLNAIKKEQFPWMKEVTKYAAQQPLQNLGKAWQSFFKKSSSRKIGMPRFKKKGRCRDSFYIGGDQIKVKDDCFLWVPLLGFVRMAEKLRYQGHINSVVISKKADKWFVSFSIDITIGPRPCKSQTRCGVDLGSSSLATLSRGDIRYWNTPKPFYQAKRRLASLQRKLFKKAKGSHQRQKQKMKIARLHLRISNIRENNIHQLTSYLVNNFSSIVIEDLNVGGMLKNHRLALAIADASFHEVRRQLEYKCQWYNRQLILADRWYPSSQICSDCGTRHKMKLSQRVFECSCGNKKCRDFNASINLENYTASSAEIYAAADDGSEQVA